MTLYIPRFIPTE